MDREPRSSARGRHGGGGVLGSDFCSPAPPSQWRMLRRHRGVWESVQESFSAGVSGDGQEDDVICTRLWIARWRIWRQLSTALTGCVRSEARCLAWGEAPTDDLQRQRSRLRRATFEVLKADAQRWSRAVLGLAGLSSPVLWWSLRRRRRRGTTDGGAAGTLRDSFVISCFRGFFLHLYGLTWPFWLLPLGVYVSCTRCYV
jgi:hypothetical protein